MNMRNTTFMLNTGIVYRLVIGRFHVAGRHSHEIVCKHTEQLYDHQDLAVAQ